jgi:hypothetical protein
MVAVLLSEVASSLLASSRPAAHVTTIRDLLMAKRPLARHKANTFTQTLLPISLGLGTDLGWVRVYCLEDKWQ